jgi:hypothetical protein
MNRNIGHTARKQQSGRMTVPRQWKVIAVPVGETQNQTPKVLMANPEQDCREHYERLRADGWDDPRALVLVDGFGMPVYAASP